MTTDIIAMNPMCAVLAADSAVSADGNIFYGAEKIFELFPGSPVGIVIHGEASIMGIPFAVILGEYRKSINREIHISPEEYMKSFLSFMTTSNTILSLHCKESRECGIAFAGYGLNDIFPSYAYCKFTADNKMNPMLSIIEQKSESISINQCSFLGYYGQVDIIHGLITGMRHNYSIAFISLLTQFLGETQTKNDLLNALISYEYETLIKPAHERIAILQPLDLVQFCEELIFATYVGKFLNKEREKVGGPVDVALITREKGFQWIKNKRP
jgi:hypothetical protein